jgi:hypothetical protein
MEKTTVYLPKRLKAALKRTAEAAGSSEAAVIREAIERATGEAAAPRPRLPLFHTPGADLAERVDEALAGGSGRGPAFGDR